VEPETPELHKTSKIFTQNWTCIKMMQLRNTAVLECRIGWRLVITIPD
jgi:hypothetical protein